MIRAAVVVDGLAAPTWTLDRSRKPPVVTVEPFESLNSAVEAGIEREVTNFSAFLGRDVGLKIVR